MLISFQRATHLQAVILIFAFEGGSGTRVRVCWRSCVQLSLTDVQMWPDQTRSLALISTPSARRWAWASDIHWFRLLTLWSTKKSNLMEILPGFHVVYRKTKYSFFAFPSVFLSRLRRACWLYVRTGISSLPKTLKKPTRPSSKRTSRNTSSTSREKRRFLVCR